VAQTPWKKREMGNVQTAYVRAQQTTKKRYWVDVQNAWGTIFFAKERKKLGVNQKTRKAKRKDASHVLRRPCPDWAPAQRN